MYETRTNSRPVNAQANRQPQQPAAPQYRQMSQQPQNRQPQQQIEYLGDACQAAGDDVVGVGEEGEAGARDQAPRQVDGHGLPVGLEKRFYLIQCNSLAEFAPAGANFSAPSDEGAVTAF